MTFNRQQAVDHFFNDKLGIMHLSSFINDFWTKMTKEIFIPNLVSVYDKLVEGKFSEDNPISWGDADGLLYYIPNKKRKVIVFTTQSRDYLYILSPMKAIEYFPNATDGNHFGDEYDTHSIHIRRIWRLYKPGDISGLRSLKSSVKNMLSSLDTLEEYADDHCRYFNRPSIELYRKINFNLDEYQESPRFYGDIRDPGYILSYNDRYGTLQVEGTTYSFSELSMLARCNLSIIANELEINIPYRA